MPSSGRSCNSGLSTLSSHSHEGEPKGSSGQRLQPKQTRFPRSRVSTEHSRPDRSAEGRSWEDDSTAMLRMKALRKSCMRSWDSTRTPAFLQASSTESMEPRTWSTTPRTTFSTDFRGFRCLFSRLSAIRNMRSAQQAAFERAFATRSCSWQAFKQSMNVGRRRTDQLVRIFLDRRLNQLLDTIHHSSHGAHHFVNARLFLMCLRLRPPGPDRRLRVLSHVLEACVELHKVTSQSHASPSSCKGQRLILCPQRTLRIEGLRVDMFHVEALATAELLKVPSKRMFRILWIFCTRKGWPRRRF